MTASRWQELLLPIIIAASTSVATISTVSFMLQTPTLNPVGAIEISTR